MNAELLNQIEASMKMESAKTPDQRLKECKDFVAQVQSPGGPDGPVAILDRNVVPYIKSKWFEDSVPWMLLVQIFHTDVAKLTCKDHLIPIDHDERRPIFLYTAPDFGAYQIWQLENLEHFQAYRQQTFEKIAGRWVVFEQWFARDMFRLQVFAAWLNFVTQRDKRKKFTVPNWCYARVLEQGTTDLGYSAQVYCGNPEPSREDFLRLVRGEVTLNDLGVSFPSELPTDLTTPDGRTITNTADNNITEMLDRKQKEQLGEFSSGVSH